MKPRRVVMSMVPNKSYLEGFNACLEEAEAYQEKLEALLSKVLDVYCPVDCVDHKAPELRAEAAKLMEPNEW